MRVGPTIRCTNSINTVAAVAAVGATTLTNGKQNVTGQPQRRSSVSSAAATVPPHQRIHQPPPTHSSSTTATGNTAPQAVGGGKRGNAGTIVRATCEKRNGDGISNSSANTTNLQRTTRGGTGSSGIGGGDGVNVPKHGARHQDANPSFPKQQQHQQPAPSSEANSRPSRKVFVAEQHQPPPTLMGGNNPNLNPHAHRSSRASTTATAAITDMNAAAIDAFCMELDSTLAAQRKILFGGGGGSSSSVPHTVNHHTSLMMAMNARTAASLRALSNANAYVLTDDTNNSAKKNASPATAATAANSLKGSDEKRRDGAASAEASSSSSHGNIHHHHNTFAAAAPASFRSPSTVSNTSSTHAVVARLQHAMGTRLRLTSVGRRSCREGEEGNDGGSDAEDERQRGENNGAGGEEGGGGGGGASGSRVIRRRSCCSNGTAASMTPVGGAVLSLATPTNAAGGSGVVVGSRHTPLSVSTAPAPTTAMMNATVPIIVCTIQQEQHQMSVSDGKKASLQCDGPRPHHGFDSDRDAVDDPLQLFKLHSHPTVLRAVASWVFSSSQLCCGPEQHNAAGDDQRVGDNGRGKRPSVSIIEDRQLFLGELFGSCGFSDSGYGRGSDGARLALTDPLPSSYSLSPSAVQHAISRYVFTYAACSNSNILITAGDSPSPLADSSLFSSSGGAGGVSIMCAMVAGMMAMGMGTERGNAEAGQQQHWPEGDDAGCVAAMEKYLKALRVPIGCVRGVSDVGRKGSGGWPTASPRSSGRLSTGTVVSRGSRGEAAMCEGGGGGGGGCVETLSPSVAMRGSTAHTGRSSGSGAPHTSSASASSSSYISQQRNSTSFASSTFPNELSAIVRNVLLPEFQRNTVDATADDVRHGVSGRGTGSSSTARSRDGSRLSFEWAIANTSLTSTTTLSSTSYAVNGGAMISPQARPQPQTRAAPSTTPKMTTTSAASTASNAATLFHPPSSPATPYHSLSSSSPAVVGPFSSCHHLKFPSVFEMASAAQRSVLFGGSRHCKQRQQQKRGKANVTASSPRPFNMPSSFTTRDHKSYVDPLHLVFGSEGHHHPHPSPTTTATTSSSLPLHTTTAAIMIDPLSVILHSDALLCLTLAATSSATALTLNQSLDAIIEAKMAILESAKLRGVEGMVSCRTAANATLNAILPSSEEHKKKDSLLMNHHQDGETKETVISSAFPAPSVDLWYERVGPSGAAGKCSGEVTGLGVTAMATVAMTGGETASGVPTNPLPPSPVPTAEDNAALNSTAVHSSPLAFPSALSALFDMRASCDVVALAEAVHEVRRRKREAYDNHLHHLRKRRGGGNGGDASTSGRSCGGNPKTSSDSLGARGTILTTTAVASGNTMMTLPQPTFVEDAMRRREGQQQQQRRGGGAGAGAAASSFVTLPSAERTHNVGHRSVLDPSISAAAPNQPSHPHHPHHNNPLLLPQQQQQQQPPPPMPMPGTLLLHNAMQAFGAVNASHSHGGGAAGGGGGGGGGGAVLPSSNRALSLQNSRAPLPSFQREASVHQRGGGGPSFVTLGDRGGGGSEVREGTQQHSYNVTSSTNPPPHHPTQQQQQQRPPSPPPPPLFSGGLLPHRVFEGFLLRGGGGGGLGIRVGAGGAGVANGVLNALAHTQTLQTQAQRNGLSNASSFPNPQQSFCQAVRAQSITTTTSSHTHREVTLKANTANVHQQGGGGGGGGGGCPPPTFTTLPPRSANNNACSFPASWSSFAADQAFSFDTAAKTSAQTERHRLPLGHHPQPPAPFSASVSSSSSPPFNNHPLLRDGNGMATAAYSSAPLFDVTSRRDNANNIHTHTSATHHRRAQQQHQQQRFTNEGSSSSPPPPPSFSLPPSTIASHQHQHHSAAMQTMRGVKQIADDGSRRREKMGSKQRW